MRPELPPRNGREASRLGRSRARAAAREPELLPELARVRKGTRAQGTNLRARGVNPRAQGTNPTAGQRTDADRVARMKRQALARYFVREGERWCLHCDDTGWVYPIDGDGHAEPCADHRLMTASDAFWVLHPDE